MELKKGSEGPLLVEEKMVRASYYLQKITTADDVEVYLTASERVAALERRQKEQ